MTAPRLNYARPRIWDQVPRAPEPDRVGDLRRQAWHGLGLIVIDPEDVADEWLRAAIIGEAEARYGRRGRR